MEIVLFIFYLVACSFILIKLPIVKNSGLGNWTLPLFALKIIAGFAYAWFYKQPKNLPTADTWRFYDQSTVETRWLLSDPAAFIKDIFHHGYATSGNIFSGQNSYWNDLKSNLFVKLMAVFNVLTNNSYSTNIILFNLLFIVGLVALFRIFNEIYPGKKLLIIAGVFLTPSALFWCSGIHKDGLILSAICLATYLFHKSIKSNSIEIGRLLVFIACFSVVLFLRNYLALSLIPALLWWFLAEKSGFGRAKLVAFIYGTGLLLFFTLPVMFPALNFPGFLVAKQQEFLRLTGGSFVSDTPLDDTAASFLVHLPGAIRLALFSPLPKKGVSFAYLPAMVEVILISILIALLIIRGRLQQTPSFTIAAILFSAAVLLITGYTVPFVGAIVRYRSIVYPFLLTSILCSIRWRRG